MAQLFLFKKVITSFKFLFSVTLFCVITIVSCGSKKDLYDGPPGYDFSKPSIVKLPIELDEISGIIYYAKDTSLFAIQDEKGWLFKIHLKPPMKIEKWKFSNSGDYEDITRIDSTFFVLKSKGVIEKFKFLSGDSLSFESFKVPGDKKNEFETLFYDSSLHQLVLMCKNCEDDKKKQVSSFAFDPASDSFSSAFTIETSAIREQLNDDQRFKPSAAAFHPITGDLYVLASVNKALVIFNKDHSVKNVFKIDPNLFKQPEGIAFTPKGDLIISNEANDKNNADIIFFKYDKSKNRQ